MLPPPPQLEQAERRGARGRGRDPERRRKRRGERGDGPPLAKEELEPKRSRGAEGGAPRDSTPPPGPTAPGVSDGVMGWGGHGVAAPGAAVMGSPC